MHDNYAPRVAPTPGYRKCVKCKDRKPVSQYRPDARTISGHDWLCLACRENRERGRMK